MSKVKTYLREKPELGFDFKMVSEFLTTRCEIHGSALLGIVVFCKRQMAFAVKEGKQFMVERCNAKDNAYLVTWTTEEEQIFHPIQIIQYQNSFEFSCKLWECIAKVI